MPAPCRFRGLFWKAARIGVLFSLLSAAVKQNVASSTLALIDSCSSANPLGAETVSIEIGAGERLSPWVAVFCIVMGLVILVT